MADNYIERQYQAYLERKAAQEKARKAVFRRQLQAYKARLAAAQRQAQQAGQQLNAPGVDGEEAPGT